MSLGEGDCGDGGVLTTYSPYPVRSVDSLSRRVVPVAAPLQPSRVAALAGHRHVRFRRHPRCRSGGFRFLAPDSPRLSAAARLADFGGIEISPTQWTRWAVRRRWRRSDGC